MKCEKLMEAAQRDKIHLDVVDHDVTRVYAGAELVCVCETVLP